MSRGRRHHSVRSRRRVLVTPQGSAVAYASLDLILTPTTILLTLKRPSALAIMPSQPSEAGSRGAPNCPETAPPR
jgi:hypothetical protein